MNRLSHAETEYLWQEYSRIDTASPSLTDFLDEIYAVMRRVISFGPAHSLIDIGCGRGYFIEYLQRKGHAHVCGIDPCDKLIANRLSDRAVVGSFEDNPLGDGQFDIAFICHTLHHLPDSNPVSAVQDALRLAGKYVVIVEINNTNLPMLLVSLLNRSVERNAWRYNKRKVASLIRQSGGRVVHQSNLRCGYLSGRSVLHRTLQRVGSPPYNVLISRKNEM